MPSNRPEDDIMRLKVAIADAKRMKDDFEQLMKEMNATLAKLTRDKAKDRGKK